LAISFEEQQPNEIAKRPISNRAGTEGHALSAQSRASRRRQQGDVFFLRFGFTVAEWQRLAEALLRHARENEVAAMEQTAHGHRYVVDGPLTAPDGSRLNVAAHGILILVVVVYRVL